MYHSIIKNKKARLAAASIVLVFGACSQPNSAVKDQGETAITPVKFQTSTVQLLNPEYEISVPAELKPFEQVVVFAKVSGFVKQIAVERGDRVRKGQLLAVLEAPEMQQNYLTTKSIEQKAASDYLYAKQAYERLVEAAKTTGAVAAIELDRTKNAMESAKSAYEATKSGRAHSSQLQEYLRITAPFDGIITERNVSVGALVGTGANTPLFVMAQGNKLRLTLSLPEKHASSVKDGMTATFTVSSQPGKTFDAVLSRSSGMLDQRDRSLKLEFDVDNAPGELQGGDYAQVKLKLQRKKPSNWVNTKSVLQTQSGVYVLTLNDDEVKRIPVTTAAQLDTLTEVFGNISANDKIIVKPSEEIKEGKINK